MDGYSPFGPWKRDASPGEVAQKWASYGALALGWYLDVKLTPKEVDALAVLLAKFIAETKKKTGVDLVRPK